MRLARPRPRRNLRQEIIQVFTRLLTIPAEQGIQVRIRKAYGKKVGSLLQFLRELFEFEDLPDYQDVVRRQFQVYINQQPYNADQLRFLRAVENVFLQKRRLQLLDLYESPFTAFGTDAVERLFTPEQVRDILSFTNTLAA